MTTKMACEIRCGERVCEADGFVWVVTAVEAKGASVRISFAPEYTTAAREQPCERLFRSRTLIRVAATRDWLN